jgi:transposase
MELHAIGIDRGKTVFHLVGLNLGGEVVVRKKCSRKQLLHFRKHSVGSFQDCKLGAG